MSDDGEVDRAFGKRVVEARRATAMTQTELGEKVGLTRSSIANIEGGRQNPTIANAQLLADALGVSTGWLLSGEMGPVPTELVYRLKRLLFGYERVVEMNRAMGWPDMADCVSWPAGFAKNLTELLDEIEVTE